MYCYLASSTPNALDETTLDELEQPSHKRKSNSHATSQLAKRLQFHFNPTSKPTEDIIPVFYLSETTGRQQLDTQLIFDITRSSPAYYPAYNEWERRFGFYSTLESFLPAALRE